MDATRARLFGVLVLVGKPVSARELVALCRPLGISATNVKSHLTRLVAEGALLRTGRRRAHRYAISAQRQGFVHAISSRLALLPAEPWDGQWLMVAMKTQTRREERQQLRDRLWFDGFRPCGPDTYLRPAWPRAWALALAEDLMSVASACVMGPLVSTLHLGQVRKLYRLRPMDAEARRLARQIETIGRRVKSPDQAFKVRHTIGGLVAGLVSHVPTLPRTIWGDLTGLRDLQLAYARLEARVVPLSDAFVGAIVSGTARIGVPIKHLRATRGAPRRTAVNGRGVRERHVTQA